MKKIMIMAALLFLSYAVSAQGGWRISGKGGYNFTWLMNGNINNDAGVSYSPSFGWTAGLSVGYNATYFNIGFTWGIFLKQYTEKLEGDVPNISQKWESETKLQYITSPILFRVRPSGDKMSREFTYGGPYFEIGLEPQVLLSARGSRDYPNDSLNVFSYSKRDLTDDFEKFNIAGVIGFGIHHVATDNLAITHGIRMSYGILDIVNPNGDRGGPYTNVGTGRTSPYTPTRSFSAGYLLTVSYKFFKPGR